MVRSAALGLVASILLVGVAQAQTTQCHWMGSNFICQQDPPPPAPFDPWVHQREGEDFVDRLFEQRRERDLAAARAARQSQADQAALDHEQTRREVALTISEGRCADAKAIALSAGDLDLAEQAQRLCTPK